MTGPAYGKLLLKNSKVIVRLGTSKKLLEGADVYIHVKGYSLARVTHLDIEHRGLDGLIRGKGAFLTITGTEGGIEIKIGKGKTVEVINPLLKKVLPLKVWTRAWVGAKEGGMYVGFKKDHVRLLEDIAREEFGLEPS